MNLFNKANKLYSSRMEPFFYKALTLIRFTHKLIDKSDSAKRIQYYKNAMKNLDKALECNQSNANLFYYRGLLQFALNDKFSCVQELEKAIEKSEDNIPKYFYLRGLAYSCSQ